MSGAKAQWRSLKAGWLASLPGRDRNITARIVYGLDAPDPIDSVMLPVRNLVSQGQLEAAAQHIRTIETSPWRSRTGRPAGSHAAGLLLEPFDDEDVAHYERLLSPYSAWAAQRTDCPLAVASHAGVLIELAFAHRGSDWAQKVGQDAWKLFRSYASQAQAVMDASGAELRTHPYWQRTQLRVALAAGLAVEHHWDRFYRAVGTSPTDTALYSLMTHHLLPRWFGSIDAIAGLASWSADYTQGLMGQTAYAVVYSALAKYETGFEDQFDWSRVVQGYRDWRALCSDDAVLAGLASQAFDRNDMTTCLDVLESVEMLHLGYWTSETPYERANSLCREFVGR